MCGLLTAPTIIRLSVCSSGRSFSRLLTLSRRKSPCRSSIRADQMFRGYGAIVVLAALFFIAAKIGDTFAQTLTIFSIFIWTIAAALFAYLILFRGIKLSFFGFGKRSEEQPAELQYLL